MDANIASKQMKVSSSLYVYLEITPMKAKKNAENAENH